MRRIDYSTLADWCAEKGYELCEWRPVLRGPARTFTCRKLDRLQQLPEFLDLVVNTENAERLVWIRDWTIWNDRSQGMGLRALELITGNLSAPERKIDSH